MHPTTDAFLPRMRFLAVLLLAALLLAGCPFQRQPTATPAPTASPVDVPLVSSSARAAGTIVPVQKAVLAFTVAGRVTSIEVAVGDQVDVGAVLIRLEDAVAQAQLAQAQAARLYAQANLAELQAGPVPEQVAAAQAHLQASQAVVAEATAGIQSAQATLANLVLRAPFTGTITALNIALGEMALPGQPVLTVADLSHLQVETTDLSERDLAQVAVGAPVTVFVEALNQEIPGRIRRIALQSKLAGGDVVYPLTIELNEQPPKLRWGMSVDVDVRTP